MALSTLFWRPVNLFRARTTRADSLHTSCWGLVRIYRTGDQALKTSVVNNLSDRILTGSIVPKKSPIGRVLPVLPGKEGFKLFQIAVINCGIPQALGKTIDEMQLNHYPGRVVAGLNQIAQTSTDTEVLSKLCENTQEGFAPRICQDSTGTTRTIANWSYPICVIAALNPNTRWEDVAKALSRMPKEEVTVRWETVHDINTDTYEVGPDYRRACGWKMMYAGKAREWVDDVFKIHRDNWSLIMNRLNTLNPKLHRFLTS